MQTFKTKNPVLIDPIKVITDTVYILPQNVCFDGFVYRVDVVYYIKDPVTGENEVIANYDMKFTVEEANAYESSLSVVGSTISERLTDLLTKGTLHLLGENGIFGLTSADFEVYNEE